jgi:hypothetical protein
MRKPVHILLIALTLTVGVSHAQRGEQNRQGGSRVQGFMNRMSGRQNPQQVPSQQVPSQMPQAVPGSAIPGYGPPSSVQMQGPAMQSPEMLTPGRFVQPEAQISNRTSDRMAPGTVDRMIPPSAQARDPRTGSAVRSGSVPAKPTQATQGMRTRTTAPPSGREVVPAPTVYADPRVYMDPRAAAQPTMSQRQAGPVSTRELRRDFNSAHKNLETAIQKNNSTEVDASLDVVRTRAEDMRGRIHNLPPQQKLQMSTISRMYDRGADLIEEGRRNGEDSKLRLGVEKIGHANDQFDRVKLSEE